MKEEKLDAYEDPNDPGNATTYYTGKKCITVGCDNPAGTAWGPYWCFKCNVKRIKGIEKDLKSMIKEV